VHRTLPEASPSPRLIIGADDFEKCQRTENVYINLQYRLAPKVAQDKRSKGR